MALPVDPRARYPQPPYRTGRQERPGELADMTPAPDHGEESYVGRGRLVDRVALVTGGDSGIGRAVRIGMARAGADVLVTHLERERDEAEEVVTLVRNADRRGDRVEVDLSEEDGCRAAVARAVERFDRLDVLVNNAGTQVVVDSFEQITAVEQFGAGAPIGRVAQPVELAGAFVFLASDEASFVTGETVAVTGGRTLWARSTGRVSRR